MMKLKKLFCLILCLIFLASIFPFSAAADDGTGDTTDDPDVESIEKGYPDLTEYEFPAVTRTIADVPLPMEEGEEQGFTSCEVSFTPVIKDGNRNFYIVNSTYGPTVVTIRGNDIYERADIEEEDIFIEKPDLVTPEGTDIIISGYDENSVDYYTIIFRVSFRAMHDLGPDNIRTVEFTLPVYDSPFLAVETDYNDDLQTHYHPNWAAYLDEDIWNSTIEVNLLRDSASGMEEPVEGVDTRIFFYWGDSSAPICIFDPDSWTTTDSSGTATFVTGTGLDSYERLIYLASPAIYAKLAKGNDDLSQYYSFPDLKDFEGIVKVKVQNLSREPLEGRTVQLWGGPTGDVLNGGMTGSDGITEIRFPDNTTSSDETELVITELPTVEISWNLTQVVDNPDKIVVGHNAPLYLSPTVKIADGYSSNPYTKISGIKLEVYDVDDPDKVIADTSERFYKERYDNYRDIIVNANHRAYIKIEPQLLNEKRLGIRAVVKNNDEGARDRYQVRGNVVDPVDERQLYEPKKTFTFVMVPLMVGAEENNFSVSYGDLTKQKEFIRKIFPAPVRFVEKSPMFIAKPRFFTHNMYLSRILRELDREQKRFADKYDLYIGLAPVGFLGAAGLQDSGMYGLNWEFLGAAHGAILIDPAKVMQHTTLHEFIHTFGFSDVYPEDGDSVQSANGHDGRPINNVPGESPYNEMLMYDSASAPWPTAAEYSALLNYATKPKSEGRERFAGINALSADGVQEVLLVSGRIEDARTYARKVFVDPIIKQTGTVDVEGNYGDNDYVIQTLDSEGNILTQYFFSDYLYEGKYYASFMANLPAEDVHMIEIGKQQWGDLTQLFKRYEYSAHAPEVSLTGPVAASLAGNFAITWEARDDDDDALRLELLVSADGGSSWDVIAADIPDQPGGEYSYTVDATKFPQDGTYKFKVIVTDGLNVTEAVSAGTYTISGYEQKPELGDLAAKADITVKAGTGQAAAYFELVNDGTDELEAEFILAEDTMIPASFTREYTLFPGQSQLVRVPLILPDGEAEDTFSETITLLTNDPEKAEIELTINIEYVEEAQAPELAYLFADLADFAVNAENDLLVTFHAYAEAGQSGLEATIIIDDQEGNVILSDTMVEDPHEPGVYTYIWEHEALSPGDYKVYIGFEDTQEELTRDTGFTDLTFSAAQTNLPPCFVDPGSAEPVPYENDLGIVQRGQVISIPYQVSDPEGDELTIQVSGNLVNYGLELIPASPTTGIIEWTANRSGAHCIYLRAADTAGNSAEAVFTLAELADLKLYDISVTPNAAEKGQAYGGGLYDSGEYVIATAVPEEGFDFAGWIEEETVVSTDPVYIFKANAARELTAQFEAEPEFSYYESGGKAIITGFDSGFNTNLVIPAELDGLPVVGIGDAAFYSMRYGGQQISSLSLPDTLNSIGMNAFRTNLLTEVSIPASVSTIGDYAFGNNDGLTTAVVHNPKAVIGKGAFAFGSDDLVIHGVTGSTAHAYASENNLTFVAIPAPTTYSVVISGGGSGVSGAGSYAANAAVTIDAGTLSGYIFDGWTSDDVTFADATATTTTFVMPAQNVTLTANWRAEETEPGGGDSGGGDTGGSGGDGNSGGTGGDGGSSSSGSGSSDSANNTAPNPAPTVKNDPAKAVIASEAINKETVTTPEGKTLETFVVQTTAASQIQQAKEEGKSSVEFNIASTPSAVIDIAIPAMVLESAAGLEVAVSTPHATLKLPAALVDALAAAGKNLNLTVTRGEAIADPEGGSVLGATTEITSDIVGETQVSIPLEGISLPTDPAARAEFLNRLAVFTHHSDGDIELISGEIIYDDKGDPVSISFPVKKFSTFAIVRLSQRKVSLTIGSPVASLNSLPVAMDAPAYVEPKSNRTLVPLRFIGETLGAKVEWLSDKRQVKIKDGEREILLTLDSPIILVNGQSIQIDCAPLEVLPGRIYLPLRFIGEALGAEVTYDDATKGINITREYKN